MVKVRGVLENGVIRLEEPLDLPPGTQVEVTIEPKGHDPEIERRQKIVQRILSREPIDIRPYTVRDLIEDGRER